jgi:hypothetical protein
MQLAPGARDSPHVLLASLNPEETDKAKSDSITPPPEFVIVTVAGLLVAPTPVVAKVRSAGRIWTEPVAPPIPLSTATAGVLTVDELTVSAPVQVPLVAGVKTTPVVQADPAARFVPHVFCVRLKGPETITASPLALIPPVLEMVTVCEGLACPSACAAKLSCDGFTLSPAAVCPAPLRETVAAFTPRVDEEIVKLAAAPPDAVGVKMTCTVQLLPLARFAPQVVASVAKLPADGPVIWKPMLAIGAPPLLMIVRVEGELATPTCCAVKVKLAGLTVKAGGIRPTPESAMVCELFSESETVNIPVCVPPAVGLNTTPMVQLDLAASCVVQLVEI